MWKRVRLYNTKIEYSFKNLDFILYQWKLTKYFKKRKRYDQNSVLISFHVNNYTGDMLMHKTIAY